MLPIKKKVKPKPATDLYSPELESVQVLLDTRGKGDVVFSVRAPRLLLEELDEFAAGQRPPQKRNRLVLGLLTGALRTLKTNREQRQQALAQARGRAMGEGRNK